VDDEERLEGLRERMQAEHYKEEARKEHEMRDRQRRAMEHTKIFLLILGVIFMGLVAIRGCHIQ
jgi:hypothetical protein